MSAQTELSLVEVVTWSYERLAEAMREAPAPEREAIEGWEFDGYNVPFVTSVLGFRKFKKGFYGSGDALRGYNVKIVNEANPRGSWTAILDAEGRPVRHGFYDVVEPRGVDTRHPQALLIDYDCGRNPWYDPSGKLRDYVVQLGPDLLLGDAYLAVGGRTRIGPVSFFVLRRANRIEDPPID